MLCMHACMLHCAAQEKRQGLSARKVLGGPASEAGRHSAWYLRFTPCAHAQFGVPLYGGALTGEVVFAEANKLGCDVFERPLQQAALPVFLLVDRGDCYFIEKVRPPGP